MLTNFYRDIQCWIDAGCPEPNPHFFRKRRGLCANLDTWTMINVDITHEESIRLDKELEASFIAADLDSWYPFNGGGGQSFTEEADELTLYQNPKRLEWIRKHAEI